LVANSWRNATFWLRQLLDNCSSGFIQISTIGEYDMKSSVQITTLAILLTLLASLMSVAQANISFGVQAPRGNAKALKKWNELGVYLEQKIGQSVKIVPLKPNKTVKAVTTGKVDYMLSNPAIAVVLMTKNGSKPIATMKKKSGHQFAGVIISKKGSGIKQAKDLVGKKVMAFKFYKSAAAYVFQVKHMQDKGINPHQDFKLFKQAKKQDDIVYAVKRGVMDAGFIKSGLLEAMAKEGKINMDDFTIVDQQSDGFPNVHSTQLYPSWTVTASPSADSTLTEKIKSALLALTAKDKSSKNAKIVTFVEPASLDGLTNTMKQLKIAPFN